MSTINVSYPPRFLISTVRLRARTGSTVQMAQDRDAERGPGYDGAERPAQGVRLGAGLLFAEFGDGGVNAGNLGPHVGNLGPHVGEHTALLTRDERERLQRRFSNPQPWPWEPNLLSATPTLELGIDVDHLSTVVLGRFAGYRRPTMPLTDSARAGAS